MNLFGLAGDRVFDGGDAQLQHARDVHVAVQAVERSLVGGKDRIQHSLGYSGKYREWLTMFSSKQSEDRLPLPVAGPGINHQLGGEMAFVHRTGRFTGPTHI